MEVKGKREMAAKLTKEHKTMIAASGADLHGDGRELLEAKVIERLSHNSHPTKNQVRAAITATLAAGK
jgi:hypothetical protein